MGLMQAIVTPVATIAEYELQLYSSMQISNPTVETMFRVSAVLRNI